eukprot:2360350-Amphidinium_carterae.6
MGHRAIDVDSSWSIRDNWLLKEAKLADGNGKRGMTCFEFFEDVEGFAEFSSPMLEFEEEEEAKSKGKAKAAAGSASDASRNRHPTKQWRFVGTDAGRPPVAKVATADTAPAVLPQAPAVSARMSSLLMPSRSVE